MFNVQLFIHYDYDNQVDEDYEQRWQNEIPTKISKDLIMGDPRIEWLLNANTSVPFFRSIFPVTCYLSIIVGVSAVNEEKQYNDSWWTKKKPLRLLKIIISDLG